MFLVDNIGCLATLAHDVTLGEIYGAAVLIKDETIFWCGKKTDLPKVLVSQRVDAENQLVIPGLVDCHSHLVFAGERANEFKARMSNESYESFMEKGYGIYRSSQAFKETSDEDLFNLLEKRAYAILLQGVTTLEAKSGYGLSLMQELRALKLLRALDNEHALDLHVTCLAGHAMPEEYLENRDYYVSMIVEELLTRAHEERLAIDCDVFCDRGAFSVNEARCILTKAHELGFGLRAHVHQLSANGGVSLVEELPIRSISHADYLRAEDIALLATKDTVVEALPFAALFLRSQKLPPIRALMQAKVKLAIATDFNPGSAMCHDLVLAARLGVTYFHFTLEEALQAITKNAAKSLGRDNIGSLKKGNLADLVITNCHDVNEFFYDWTKHPVKTVIKRGRIFSELFSKVG